MDTTLDKLPLTKLAQGKLARLGLKTLHNIIHYYPFRYDEFPPPCPVKQARKNGPFTTKGQLTALTAKRNFKTKRTWLEGTISDPMGELKILWFNQPYLAQQLKVDDFYSVQGESKWGSVINPIMAPATTSLPLYYPVYPLKTTIALWWLRRTINQVLNDAEITEYLPEKIRVQNHLIGLSSALHNIHTPTEQNDLRLARTRLAFDEIFFYNLKTQVARQTLEKLTGISLDKNKLANSIVEIMRLLPFTLSPSQQTTLAEISTDLLNPHPMHRLLLGDVGSGKTIVAGAAGWATVEQNFQAVFLCPTTILAKQHFRTLQKILAEKISVKSPLILLTSAESFLINGAEIIDDKYVIAKYLASGVPALIIGTHAILQNKIKMPSLALAIIDEQHRFGVGQRQILQTKRADNITPHLLSLSATPIPRTLAQTFFGDINISHLQMPDNKNIERQTEILGSTETATAIQKIKKTIARGEQAIIVCPAIEAESRVNVQDIHKELAKKLPGINIGLLHGNLKTIDQNKAVEEFTDNKTPVLVATTMIEVGVHIENTTLLVVFGAECFGLAQLHQLRGRVGRGDKIGTCLCIVSTDDKLEHERLLALKNHHHGEELAELDMSFRGSGDLSGTRQTGFWDLKIARLTDIEIVQTTQKIASETLSEDPSLEKNEALKHELMSRFSTEILDKQYIKW